MATREQLIEANKKAVLSPRIGKHGKRKATLEKEEAIRIFREKQSQVWEKTIEKLPPVYIADRMMGKEAEKHEVELIEKKPLPPEKIEQIDKIMLDDK